MRTQARLGRRFQLLFAASSISTLGDGISLTALPLLAAQLSRDPLPVSLVSSAGYLPWLVFGLMAGAVADRRDRRRLMWAADVFRAVVLVGLAVAVLADVVTIWALAVFAFCLGSAGTLFDSAAHALLPAIVPAQDEPLQRANGRLFGAQMVGAQLVGPAVGGALFAVAAAAPFTVDAATFAASAILIVAIRGRFLPQGAAGSTMDRRSLWHDIVEGVRWLVRHRLLRTLALLVATINAATAAGEAVLVLFVTGRLGLTETGYGLLVAAGALGGVVGSLTAARIASRVGIAATLRYSIILSALGAVGVGLARTALACGIAFAVTSYSAILFNVAGVPLRQLLVPDALRGRVLSAYRMLAWGAIPAGGIAGGVVATGAGLRAPFFFGALLFSCCALVSWLRITPDAVRAARAAVPT